MKYQVGASAQDPYSSPGVLQPPVELEFWVASPDIAEKIAKSLETKLKGFQKSQLQEVATEGGTKKYKIVLTGAIGDGKAGK